MRSATECVNGWNEAMAVGDRDKMNALLHSDYRLFEPAGMPYAGTFEGSAGWWAFWDLFQDTWTDIAISDFALFLGENPEEATIYMKLSGMSVKTGKPFSTSLIELWRFKDGKILEMHPHYCDTRYLSEVAGTL